MLALLLRTTTMPPWTLLYCSGTGRCGRNLLPPRRCNVEPGRRAAREGTAAINLYAGQPRHLQCNLHTDN